LWIGGGLVVLCLCGFVFLALTRGGREGQSPGQALATEPGPPPTIKPAELPTDPPEIFEARQLVGQNPDDPRAHLLLAEALRLHGFDRLATDEYLDAAELFLGIGADFDAAMAAFQALHLGGGPGPAGPRAENLAVQSAFLAGDNPAIAPLLGEANDLYKGWEPLPAITARAALYLGRDEEADHLVELALASRPGDPMARAVRAEALYLRGEPIQGQEFARQVLEQPRLPPWLADHLAQMIANPPVR
jgi:hypothetical protein